MPKKINFNLLLIPPPVSFLTTGYYVLSRQWSSAAVAFILFLLFSVAALISRFFSRVKYHADKKLDQRAEHFAEWLTANLEAFLIKQWLLLTSKFQRNYYKQLTVKYITYRTQGPRTKGPYPLNMERVFVPLRLIPESPNRISPRMIQERVIGGTLLIWDFLAMTAEKGKYKHFALIGAPGSGKTTLLEHLSLSYVQGTHRLHHRKAPRLIPVLIHVREVKNEIILERPPSLAQLIQNQNHIKKLSPPPDWFEDRLRRGKCLVMIDGLDEVANISQRENVNRWVNDQMEQYHESIFILTSRPYGYDNDVIKPNFVLEVQPFDLNEMKSFVSRWYLETEIKERMGKEDEELHAIAQSRADDLIGRILNSPPLAAMAVNPLLLAMIAMVHKHRDTLPEHRVKLYAEICDALLGRREEAKKIPDTMPADKKQAVLQVLALALTKMGILEFTLSEGSALIREALANVPKNKTNPSEFLRKVEKVSGVLVETGSETYEFAHRSFQDYLTSVQIKETHQESLLIENINNTWWAETTRLYAAQSDATEVVRAALISPTINSLSLASDCLEEAKLVLPSVREQLENTLTAGLESPDATMAKLVASVKLSQRLNRLLRVDERISIDIGYMSCAEYQLFINDRLKVGMGYQPDHWSDFRFAQGQASEPIIGIRPDDAKEFCSWLSTQYPLLGFKYDLPDRFLIESLPISEEEIGCWCNSGNKTIIVTANPELKKYWRERLIGILVQEIYEDVERAPATNFDLSDFLEQIREKTRSFDFDAAFTNASKFESDLDLNTVYNFHHFLHAVPEERALARADILNELRNKARVFGKGLIPSKSHSVALDYAFDRTLSIKDGGARATAIKYIRYYSLLNLFFWFLRWDDLQKTGRISDAQPRKFDLITRSQHSKGYELKMRKALDTYSYLVLVKARSDGSMPVWEGLRIIREKYS